MADFDKPALLPVTSPAEALARAADSGQDSVPVGWMARQPDSEPPSSASFDGEDFLFHLYRGSELLQDNFVKEAKEELEQALALQPRDIEGQGLLGVVYFRLGMYPRAIQIYEEIVRSCPTEISPRVNLALCYFKTGQTAASREHLEEVIRQVPDHVRAWGYLGLVFERLSDFSKALTAFERASQPHMARRMQQLIEDQAAFSSEQASSHRRPDQEELRRAAADAVQELEDETRDHFTFADSAMPGAPSRSGRWDTTEPGEEPLPPPSRPQRPPSLTGRFGPAVPQLPDLLDPGSSRSGREASSEAPASFAPPVREQALAPAAFVERARLSLAEGQRSAVDELGNAVVRVAEKFTVRLEAVRALLAEGPAFTAKPAFRRQRGQDTEAPLGGATQPLYTLGGSGLIVLRPAQGKALVALMLAGEFVYLREDRLVGLDGEVQHQNGRLRKSGSDEIGMVQLSGNGGVVFELRPSARALYVDAEHPLVIHADDVVGWTGRLLPHPLDVEKTPGGLHGLTEFSGEGAVFVEFG